MKTYAMVAANGRVQFVVNHTTEVPVIEGLTAVEVRPGFDGADMCWDGAQFVKGLAGPDLQEAAALARARRSRLLAASDWTQGKDATTRITKAKQAEWAAYRQALCDITKQPGFPASIQWPVQPG